MTCKEARELVSARIDDELEELLSSRFTEHINECRSCRNEYDLERMTKSIVRQSVVSAKAPPSLAMAIRRSIETESSPEFFQRGFLGRFTLHPMRRSLLAFGAIAIGLILIIVLPSKSHRSHAQPNDENLVHQAYNNFDKVLSSAFVTDVQDSDPATVARTLSKCPCNLHMPVLKKGRFRQGRHSMYKNEHIAEFVYVFNNEPIYVYETKLADLVLGGGLRMDSSIFQQLTRTGWYSENHEPDCSLILRLQDSTIYCTIADIGKEKLLALLR